MKYLMKTFLPLLIVLLTASAVLAQEPTYTLRRWTINSGGMWSGDGYAMNGIVGQPEAGESRSSGGYTLSGGFVPQAVPPLSGGSPGDSENTIYLPLILRDVSP